MIATFGVGQLLWTMIWFFLFVVWLMLVFRIIVDIFHSDDLGGLAKALWVIFIIAFTFIGILVYLIARGDKMAAREIKHAQAQQQAMQQYIQQSAGTSSSAADELHRLSELKDKGVIDDAEFQKLKDKVVS